MRERSPNTALDPGAGCVWEVFFEGAQRLFHQLTPVGEKEYALDALLPLQ